MKYILDQQEYDRLTGRYVSYDEWLEGVLSEIKYQAFAHQGLKQEKYLVKALNILKTGKEG